MKHAALFLVAVVAGCGPSVKSVTVEPARLTLSSRGAGAPLRAVLRDAKGNLVEAGKVKVAWTSSAANVATIDEAGTVTAIRSGETLVSATVGEARGSGRVVVSIPTTVTVVPASCELTPGREVVLSAAVADENGKPLAGPAPVDWSTSDAAIATVSEGKVVGVGPGVATITAAYGKVRGTSQVTVKIPEVAKLVVNPAKLKLRRGETIRLRAEALDAAGNPVTGVPLSWRSSDGHVASVAADGSVHAGKKGKAKITLSGSGKSTTVPVIVAK